MSDINPEDPIDFFSVPYVKETVLLIAVIIIGEIICRILSKKDPEKLDFYRRRGMLILLAAAVILMLIPWLFTWLGMLRNGFMVL